MRKDAAAWPQDGSDRRFIHHLRRKETSSWLEPNLRVYYGPQTESTARSTEMPVGRDTVTVPLGDILPLLADAVRATAPGCATSRTTRSRFRPICTKSFWPISIFAGRRPEPPLAIVTSRLTHEPEASARRHGPQDLADASGFAMRGQSPRISVLLAAGYNCGGFAGWANACGTASAAATMARSDCFCETGCDRLAIPPRRFRFPIRSSTASTNGTGRPRSTGSGSPI